MSAKCYTIYWRLHLHFLYDFLAVAMTLCSGWAINDQKVICLLPGVFTVSTV